VLHIDGRGVEKNAIRAAALIGRAAEQGNSDAMLDYGVLVFRGEGVQRSEKIGAQWLLLSAKRGNVIAQNRVARLYAFGKGVPVDVVEAMKWNILATRGGRGDAELETMLATIPDAKKKEAQKLADEFKPVTGKKK
jgi:TPR repeat protein